MHSYVDRLGPTLGHFFKGLQELTGWSFTILMGGPSPEMGGQIEACSVHVGSMALGHTFDQAHPNFTSGTVPFQLICQSCITWTSKLTKFHVCHASQAQLMKIFGECQFQFYLEF